MAEGRSATKQRNGEQQGVLLKTWTDSYAEVSKMWEETFLRVQKPLIETTGELAEKAAEVSKEPTTEHFRQFFDEWTKVGRASFGEVFPAPAVEYDKETLEALMSAAEESSKLYRSWASDLEENTRQTMALLKDKPGQDAIKESFEQWMHTYGKIFDQLLELSTMESTKEVIEKHTGVPDVYLGSFVHLARLWRDSYSQLYEPWVKGATKLSRKAAELSSGDPEPGAYEEFYSIWMETYRETYGKYAESMQPTKESYDSFVRSTDVFLNMYKSWIAALEQMAEKTSQLTNQGEGKDSQEVSNEFFGLWMKMYEKAFGSFFEDMPVQGPMKEMMEPLRMMAKINADTFSTMSKLSMGNFGWGERG